MACTVSTGAPAFNSRVAQVCLSRRLTQDRIDEDIQAIATEEIVNAIADEVERIKESGEYEERSKQIAGIDLKTISFNGEKTSDEKASYTIEVSLEDIDRLFSRAGRLLGNGLHMKYWKANSNRDALSVKVEVILVSQAHECMRTIENFAMSLFDDLFEKHKHEIASLTEQKRSHYKKLLLAAHEPKPVSWELPDSIPFRRSPQASEYSRHLYLEADGTFKTDLGSWEEGVLNEELNDSSVVAWLRNIDRQSWSLEIPYKEGGVYKSMYPDLIVIRKYRESYLIDILEPHDPSRSDNAIKAVGLAEFAEKHWDLYSRIQLIRKKRSPDGREHFYRLDMGVEATRRKVLAVTSNNELDRIFEEDAKIRNGS
ncbi:hypothetical protein ACFLYP_03475 [Chloroflexota bacterium]